MSIAICNRCLNFNPESCNYVEEVSREYNQNLDKFDNIHACKDFQLDLRLISPHKTFVY